MDYPVHDMKLKEIEGQWKFSDSDSLCSQLKFDCEPREEVPIDEFNDNIGFLASALDDGSLTPSDCTASLCGTGVMMVKCEFCSEKYEESNRGPHMQSHNWGRADCTSSIGSTTPDSMHLMSTSEEMEDSYDMDENYPTPTFTSRSRQNSMIEVTREQLGPHPSMQAIQLMARSPLTTERKLGQQLMNARMSGGMGRGRREPSTSKPPPSRKKQRSIPRVDMKAPLKNRREEETKPPPLRRVTITRSGEGGASKVLIRRQSKSHLLVSLPIKSGETKGGTEKKVEE